MRKKRTAAPKTDSEKHTAYVMRKRRLLKAMTPQQQELYFQQNPQVALEESLAGRRR